MLSIDFEKDSDPAIERLSRDFPDDVNMVTGNHITGSDDLITLFFAAASLGIPAIKTILVERIRAGRFRTISYKGVKYQGYTARESERIIKVLKDDGHDL